VPLFYKKRKNDERQVIDISAGELKRKGLSEQRIKLNSEHNSQMNKEEDKFKIS